MRRHLVILLLLTSAGCVPATSGPGVVRAPLPTATPGPAAAAPPPRAVDWRDWPITPGTWTYARDDRSATASFGQSGSDALAVLRCDLPNRRLFLSRAGMAVTPLTVRTSSMARVLQTGSTGGTPPYAAAVMAATDPLLDAMAFSRGRFTLEQAGNLPLVLPAWAEIGRVIEDCR